MAGFETPKYEPPKSLAPNAINKQSYDDVATQNFLENERRIRGHIKPPKGLGDAEANEQASGNEIWNQLHGPGNIPGNNPFAPNHGFTEGPIALPPKLQPPKDHPIRGMSLDPNYNRKPGEPDLYPKYYGPDLTKLLPKAAPLPGMLPQIFQLPPQGK